MKTATMTIQTGEDLLRPGLTKLFKGTVKILHENYADGANYEAESQKTNPARAKMDVADLVAKAEGGDDNAWKTLLEHGGAEGLIRERTAMHTINENRKKVFYRKNVAPWKKLKELALPVLAEARSAIETQESATIDLLGLPPRPPHNPRMMHKVGESSHMIFVDGVERKLDAAIAATTQGRNPFPAAGDFIRSCLGL